MKRKFKIYLPFIIAGMHEATVYRVDWFFRILGNSIGCFVSYFLWNAVFISSGNDSLNGFTLPQMTVYIFLMFLTTTVIYSEGIYTIGEEIRTGAIAMRMIKPVSYNSTFLFHEIGKKAITTYLIIPLIIIVTELYRTISLGYIQFRFSCFLLYIISSLLAYLINFFFNICFAFIAFFTRNIWGVNMIKNTVIGFLSGSTIPFAFLPDLLGKILSFLPFASLNYTPVMIYLGVYESKTLLFYLCLQLFWVLLFFIISKLLWRVSIKYLCVQGG